MEHQNEERALPDRRIAVVAEQPQKLAMFDSQDAFELGQRMATMLSRSSIIPDTYRAQYLKNDTWVNNPDAVGNCFIALELAHRLNLSPLVVMQQVDMIHGRPALRGTLLIGMVNGSGLFTDIEFEIQNPDNPKANDHGYRAVATNVKTGKVCYGPWITWAMVNGEGWADKRGSKWKTMPELMFQYRAAAFWSRLFAPHVTLGLYESEEAREIIEGDYVRVESTGSSAARLARTVDEAIERREAEAEQADTPASEPKPDDKPRGRRVARRTRDAEPAQDAGGDVTEKADAPADTGSDEKPPFDLGDAPEADPPADAGEPEPPTTTTRPALTLE